jgi:GT2 family glycosyltransferase
MDKTSPKVFVIVLNYNGGKTIKPCLESVFGSDYPNFEAIVVDNASRDGSFELAKKFFSKANFILNGENLGFAAGNNVAIRFALEKFADYIFLLNSDAQVGKNTISRLVAEAEKNEKAGVISPVIYCPGGKIWHAGGRISWFKMRTVHEFEIKSNIPYETEFSSGCAMLVKKDVFRKIGLLSEKYFLYYEDADFCLRARKKRFQCLVVPGAEVFHWEKSQENQRSKTYWLVLSGLIFFKKNTPVIFRPWVSFYLILRKIKNWRDVRFTKSELAKIVQKAYQNYKSVK